MSDAEKPGDPVPCCEHKCECPCHSLPPYPGPILRELRCLSLRDGDPRYCITHGSFHGRDFQEVMHLPAVRDSEGPGAPGPVANDGLARLIAAALALQKVVKP